MSESTTVTTVDAPARAGVMFQLPSPQVSLPLIAILGYTAFLISGFGSGLGQLRPLPIYAFLGLMLLALQAVISDNRSIARIVYIFLTSGFALVYAAFVYFDQKPNFAKEPLTYIIINVLLVLVFIYDAVDRRRTNSTGLQSPTGRMPGGRKSDQLAPFSFGSFAIDFAGLAVLMSVAAGLLTLLTTIRIGPIGQTPQTVIPSIDLGFNIGTIHTLPGLDLTIAIGASAIALLLLGIIGVLAVAGQGIQETSGTAVRAFGGNIGHIIQIAANQVLLSLRLVLAPLVWLIPSFSIAIFSDQFTDYLNTSATAKDVTVLDLFNPFSANSRGNYVHGLEDLGLAILAVITVILAVSVVEHEGVIIDRTLQLLGVAGRTVALTLFLFTLSLAALNALVVTIGVTQYKPFQIGSATLMSLVAGGIFALYAALRNPKTTATPTVPGA